MANKTIPIKKLKLLEKNPRRISKEGMAKLVESLEEDPGFINSRPVLVNLVDGIYQVYGGNQRVRAAKRLKWKEITCSVEENLTEKLMKSRVIKDNQTYGDFDYDILSCDYDIDLLLDCGLTLKHMHIDLPDLEEKQEKKETEKKKKVCPECGCKFD